jgi:glyoxylase-like metal-dependent hydrolase (beta-lactamase superfamily II)
MPVNIAIIPATPLRRNCPPLVCKETAQAAVADPGGDLDLGLDAAFIPGHGSMPASAEENRRNPCISDRALSRMA